MMVFQIQLAVDQNVLPLTRDYMFEAEERLRQADLDEALSPQRAVEEASLSIATLPL